MESGFEHLGDGQLLAVVDAALDALNDDRLRLPTDREQLDLLLGSLKVGARLTAWQQRLAAGVEEADVAWRAHKTSTSTWLAEAGNLTLREARRLVRAGQNLCRFTTVGAAAAAGVVLPGQAEAITTVLGELPAGFLAETIVEAEQLMVELAGSHNAAELRRLSGHLLEVLSPKTAEELEAKRLERQERLARQRRFLEFTGDGEGSVLIRGCLPTAQAEPFIQIIDAYAAAEKRGLEAIDPQTEITTPAMRRADALAAMVHQHTQQALAPVHGGDRPRIVLTMSYDKLAKAAQDAGLPDPGSRCGPDRYRRTSTGLDRAAMAVRCRHPAHRARRPIRDPRRRPHPTPSHPRHPGRPRTTRPRLCLPRLPQTTQRLPRPPHHPLVDRRQDCAIESGAGLSAPPRHHRTQPRPQRRPVESPPTTRWGTRDPAAATCRPPTETQTPHQIPRPTTRMSPTAKVTIEPCPEPQGDGGPS